MPGFPPDTGVRVTWDAVPIAVRARVEENLGARIVQATTQPRGFSPGVAIRADVEGHATVFIKAVSAAEQPIAAGMHRREAKVAGALPPGIGAPRLLSVIEAHGWVVLVFEAVDGHNPVLPWRASDLDRVLAAITDLSGQLTPSPLELESVHERLAGTLGGWSGIDDDLAALEAGWPAATAGDALLHLDLRADNILLARDRVYFVDWPHAAVGAPWVDLAAMLPSVDMQNGGDAEALWRAHPLSRGVDDEALDSFLAALAGMFVTYARRPPDLGLPTVRAFQRAQGETTLAWLRRRRSGRIAR